MAYVTEKNKDAFNSTLRDLLDRYPDTDITPVASAWLKGMAQGRELQAGTGGNLRGMLWDLKLTNDTTATGAEGPAQFELNPDARQTLVFTFPTDKVSSNELLYEIARHNFKSFVVKDFDIEQMNFGRLGMIIVRGFENQEELNHYRSVMASSADFKLPAGVRPVAISEANLQLLFDQGRSFEEYFRYLEEQNYIDAQAGLLQPDEIDTLDEAEAETEAILEAERQESQPGSENVEVVETEEETVPAPTATPETTPTPVAAPTTPATPVASKPAPKPETPEKPTPVPLLPGSEGDDPLFDD